MPVTLKDTKLWVRLKRRLLQHPQAVRVLLAAAAVVVFALFIPRMLNLVGLTIRGSRLAYSFVIGEKGLKQSNGATNILVLGIGGAGHEAADLSDSMVVLSYNQKTHKVVLFSIPRDLWIPEIRAKINTAFHYGEERKPGGGLVLAKSLVEEVVGQDIHYVAVVDTKIFEEVVNLLGGITVCVDQAFDDFKYPIAGKEAAEPESARYEHVHFDTGCQRMDGERALKFVRSRYAEGEEGTDFARSRRQQKVILAIKDRVVSPGNAFNFGLMQALRGVLEKNIDSNIFENDYPGLARLALRFNPKNIKFGQLDSDDPVTGHSGLLENPPIGPLFDYQWVLIPKAGFGQWQEIHQYILGLISS